MNRVGSAEEGIRFIVVMFISIALANWALNHVGKMEVLKGGMLDYYVMDFTSGSFIVWSVWAVVQMYEAGRAWLLDLFAPAVLHSVVLLVQFTALATNLSIVGYNSNLTFAAACLYLVAYSVLSIIFVRATFIPWAVRVYAKILKKNAAMAELKYQQSLEKDSIRSKMLSKENDFKFEDLCAITTNTSKSSEATVEDVVFMNLFDRHHTNYVLALKGYDPYFPSDKLFRDVLADFTPKFTSTPYLFQIALFWPMIAVFHIASGFATKVRMLTAGSRLLGKVFNVQLTLVDSEKNERLFKKTLNED